MKKIILSLLIVTSMQSCSQKPETMINQNPNITANNIVDEIAKQVVHYPSEKIFKIKYSNDACYFEMYVNGVRVYKKSNRVLGNTAVEINHLLFFKSRKCTVTYKMYPMFETKEYPKILNTFVDETDLELILKSYDLKNEEADDIEYIKHKAPQKEEKVIPDYSRYKFAEAGKTYYEGSFDFDVAVPYELHPPFENAQDLRKLDPKQLEAKLLKKYKEVWNVYQNKEYDNIARLEYSALKDLYVSNYDSKEIINENISILFDKIYNRTTFQMQPIEKYKIEFFANGKMAALMQDTKDNRFRGNNALWAKVDYDGGLRPYFLNIHCYIPEGETEFKVY
ncbi:hypothetical protein B0A58_02440 [Flavobacterium branchiophilum NBRC 15030 = ATCC 35035]|uniref:Lipoprotein n=1 Tax=Flavobacterium branchiophilum TaxID=55197 RepID=A0A543G275_9FLAO|nr:hypothetical protein [Flavobacterium branchiophilum]OXA80485.1 hypothetical protein B0A58_02440 [Flavobacterium branchiophilum NBRC 15030 = ATCC 35035]TQM40178.1 hypothetical protein BC670_1050 [Flavobacterium branchiophilum]GEM56121.1 hypothetical protein FB1_23420 [Flavobacterium branchiophilum NBRC 15030 = ATCC 35035]